MGLFNNAKQTQATPAQPPKHPLVAKYDGARANLLLMVALTLLNFVLTLVGSDTYFLFSSTFSQLAIGFGLGFLEIGLPQLNVVCLVVGFLSIVLYFLCWIFSKKNPGWMIVAMILFIVDTVLLLLLGLSADMILDYLCHAWVLYYLISGVAANAKMKKLPPEELVPPVAYPAEGFVNPEAPAQPSVMMVNGEPVVMEPAKEEE